MNKYLKNSLLGFVSLLLVLALVWTQLSPKKLGVYAQHQINKQLASKIRVELGPIETSLTGVTLKHISIYQRGQRPALLSLGRIEVSLAPWNLVQGGFAFEAEVYGGLVAGFFNFFSNQLTAEGSAVQFGFNSQIRKLQVLDSKPELSFSLDMGVTKGSGKLFLQVQGLQTKKLASQKTGLLVDLPRTKLDNIDLDLDFGLKNIQVDLKTTGDITGGVQGRVNFTNFNAVARGKIQLNLTVREKFSSSFLKDLGFIASLLENFQQPNGLLAVKISGSSFAPKIDKL